MANYKVPRRLEVTLAPREPDATMPIFPFGLTMGMMLSAPMVIIVLALMAVAWTGRTTPAKA